jgi:hypothetical protein
MGLDEGLSTANMRGVVIAATAYLVPGGIGALLAAMLANRVTRRMLARVGMAL